MSNLLDSDKLLTALPTLLPQVNKQLKNPQDALAALLHTALIALQFRLVGLDDESPAQESDGGILPELWNKSGPNSYEFRYKHKQSSLVFYLKIVRLAAKMIIYGIAIETSSEKTNTFETVTADYFTPGSYPQDTSAEGVNLTDGFLSPTKTNELLKQFKVKIIQNLIPKLQVQGYQEEEQTNTVQPSTSNPHARRQPPPDPPFVLPPSHQPNIHDPLRVPNVGRSDLDPLGGYNPFAPPPLFGGGDGMFVGPDHPLFRDRFARPGGGGGRGPWGGDGYLPPMGAPPGARFDPIMPGGMGGPLGPGFRGPTRGGPFGGPGRGGGAAGPDNDEFPPPGFNDMYS